MKQIFVFILFFAAMTCHAGRVTDVIELRVAPASGSWELVTGDKAEFQILLTSSNIGVNDAEIEYEISEDLMDPIKSGKVKVKNGIAKVDGGTMKKPGFLRCKVSYTPAEGTTYRAMGTVGFSPELIKPATEYPTDFLKYWEGRLEQARKVALNPEMVLLPEKCTKTVDVYQVSFSVGTAGRRFYGMLAMPKAKGCYPAIVQYPGAGVYAIDAPVAFAEQGIIAMAMGIHAIPNNLEASLYRDIEGSALSGYPMMNMERRDDYYYNRVIQGAVRAIDFIETLPEFNGCLATYGGSQGGYLSIVVGALHPSVKYIASNFPAMSDLAGYIVGRAGGWPHLFKGEAYRTPLLIENLRYYDTVNFARHINVPGYYAFGYNDLTCAPTTTYAVYNTIDAPKTLYTAPLAGHFLLTEQADSEKAAMIEFLKGCSMLQ